MQVSIRIKGHLDQGWQEWLEGLQILHETDGTSQIFGFLQDQPALYGVLNKINRLSLTLLSLETSVHDANEDRRGPGQARKCQRKPQSEHRREETPYEKNYCFRVYDPGWRYRRSRRR